VAHNSFIRIAIIYFWFENQKSLVGKFKKRTAPGEVGYSLEYDFVLQAGEMHFPMPPIP
jgi:hypothetical protein